MKRIVVLILSLILLVSIGVPTAIAQNKGETVLENSINLSSFSNQLEREQKTKEMLGIETWSATDKITVKLKGNNKDGPVSGEISIKAGNRTYQVSVEGDVTTVWVDSNALQTVVLNGNISLGGTSEPVTVYCVIDGAVKESFINVSIGYPSEDALPSRLVYGNVTPNISKYFSSLNNTEESNLDNVSESEAENGNFSIMSATDIRLRESTIVYVGSYYLMRIEGGSDDVLRSGQTHKSVARVFTYNAQAAAYYQNMTGYMSKSNGAIKATVGIENRVYTVQHDRYPFDSTNTTATVFIPYWLPWLGWGYLDASFSVDSLSVSSYISGSSHTANSVEWTYNRAGGFPNTDYVNDPNSLTQREGLFGRMSVTPQVSSATSMSQHYRGGLTYLIAYYDPDWGVWFADTLTIRTSACMTILTVMP